MTQVEHCSRAMNGLNTICGICREIIRSDQRWLRPSFLTSRYKGTPPASRTAGFGDLMELKLYDTLTRDKADLRADRSGARAHVCVRTDGL